ncbi:MAG: glycosyltransferase family 39 protein [Acidobacteriota bacterium]|nr:MAG: glycosyltransferase family 39 protein [Acidobacteriota bacterium]
MEDARYWGRWLWGLIAAHLIIWVSIGIWTQPNGTLDTIEMIMWGLDGQWGYHKHPPLAGWAAAGAYRLSGGAVWAAGAVGQLAVVTCLWAAWRLGREVLAPRLAFVGAALLECCYFFTFPRVEINNQIMMRAFSALAVVTIFLAMRRGRLWRWALGGLWLGLALLSRYDAALIGVSILALSLSHPRARSHWRGAGPYVLGLVAMIVFSPHLAWLAQNEFAAVSYVFDRSATEGRLIDHVVHPLRFAGSQLLSLLPMLFVAAPLIHLSWRPAVPRESLARAYLLTVVLGPAGFSTLVSVLLGVRLKSMWGASLWTFAGVALLHTLALSAEPSAWRRLTRRWAIVAGLLVALAAGHNTIGPWVRGKGSRVHFPGTSLAREVTAVWHQRIEGDLPIVAGPWWLAANVSLYAERPIEVYGLLDSRITPQLDDEQLRGRGGIIVWDAADPDDPTPRLLAERFPSAARLAPIRLPQQTSAPVASIEVGLALVWPQQQHTAEQRSARSVTSGGAKGLSGMDDASR